MFGQELAYPDLGLIALLIVLEGVLSIDNALVLGILAKRLPKHQQKKALTYGLGGAFVFRVIAIVTAAYLLKLWWVKLLGGGYLLFVAIKHFFFDEKHTDFDVKIGPDGHPIISDKVATAVASTGRKFAGFWSTVAVIELTDIAFAVDSILAAIAVIPVVSPDQTNPKLWVVVAGGMLGVIMMRFAAIVFIKLLDKFPRLEISAYLLILVIGLKLVADWAFNKPPENRAADWHPPVDFHSLSSVAFIIFWGLMVMCFAVGFWPQKQKPGSSPAPT